MLVKKSGQVRRKGQALVEYALLLAGIALVCTVAVAVLGKKTADVIGVMAAVMPGTQSTDNVPINTLPILSVKPVNGTLMLDTSNLGNGSDQMAAIFGSGGAAKLVTD
jgi:hypothetical protein